MTILLTVSLLLLLAAFACCVYGMAKPTAWPSAVPVAVLLLIIERLLTSLPLK